MGKLRGRERVATRTRVLLATTVLVLVATVGIASAAFGGFDPFGTNQVGQDVNGAILLPTNQWVSPLGSRILDTQARLTSSTLSPDGVYMAALGWNDFSANLTIIDVQTGQIVQTVPLQTGSGDSTDYSAGPDGPLFSADGTTLWVPQSTYLLRFSFDPTTGQATQTASIPLCGSALTSAACNPNDGPSSPSGAYLPAGMALSPDGSTLYVALNGANTLGVIDTSTNTLVTQIPVGNAPRQVVLADNGTVAYVSDEGGRPATGSDFTNLSDGTPIVADRSTGAATTGDVSVVDLTTPTTGAETREIPTGLEPTALYQSGSALFVANSNDDSVSVIDEATNTVAQTVNVNPVPGATVGSYPNAITMPDANDVLVSIGRDNAIAEYHYSGLTTPMTFEGLIPTDWYPVQVQADPALNNEIVVTNDRGIGDRGPQATITKGPGTSPATGYNTYDDTGSVTTFGLPTGRQLSAQTRVVFTDNAWGQIPLINSGSYDSVPSVIPRFTGGRSPIKHVFVIVKENRTYDQVLGDLPEGNGDPADAQFGESVTPNLHALALRFGDFDNFYDEGTLSADGHNWIVQAEANDYVEKEFGAFYRSYPAQGGDALAYQRDGFLWNAAQRAGVSVQDFGEYANFFNLPSTGAPTWDQWYQDSQILEGKASGPLPVPEDEYQTYSDIPSLNAIIDEAYPKFDLDVPDQYRVDVWLQQFRQAEQTGKLAGLTLMWMPDDHTAGVGTGDPDPVAEVADNDLAVGRIVDTISHSRFWRSTAIFVVEDDPQNGVDHVDGHRSIAEVISPYSNPGVDDNYYSQINMVRTVEQILGIQPMNQEDHSAEPMYSAFTSHPNFAPYDVIPNEIPLTLGAPGYPTTYVTTDGVRVSDSVPADERSVYAAWAKWSRLQRFNGRDALQDFAKPVMLNRLDWYSAHDWKVAYPGDKRILAPDQVPYRNVPAAFLAG